MKAHLGDGFLCHVSTARSLCSMMMVPAEHVMFSSLGRLGSDPECYRGRPKSTAR